MILDLFDSICIYHSFFFLSNKSENLSSYNAYNIIHKLNDQESIKKDFKSIFEGWVRL